jgi:hypothetical protein
MAHNLTRWIEDAEARRFHEAALFDRNLEIGETHYLHVGEAIANLTTWLRHKINGETLAAIGCQVLLRHHAGNGH